MPEEGITTESTASVEGLTRRLDRFEQDYLRENRWWRGGLVAALALLAIVLLIGSFHHRPPEPRGFGPMAMAGPMGMQGPMDMQGPMGYPGYGPPPPWAYAYGPGYGFRPGFGCRHHGWFGGGEGGPGGPGQGGPGGGNPPPPPSGGSNG
jgi:hypothetical protein